MQHHRGPESRSHIGGARSQVAQVFVIGILQGLFQPVIQKIYCFPGLFELQAGQQALQTQMVLFIDHNADNLVTADDNRLFLKVFQQVRAYKVLFN